MLIFIVSETKSKKMNFDCHNNGSWFFTSFFVICWFYLFIFQKVTKQYAFEKEEVPVESDYLEVRYGVSMKYERKGN